MSFTDPRFDLSEFQAELGAASAALQDFAQGPAKRAADDVGASFERAGVRIARALGSAAQGGENAFRRLAKVILEELAKIALQQIFTPQAPKQSGGAKFAGLAPDFGGFVGAQSGAVNVHFHLGGGADATAIARHQGQIAASVARAVAYGRRNL